MWAIVMTLGLQDVLLVWDVPRDSPSDVAYRDSKYSFPRSAGSSRITPTTLEGVLSTGSRSLGSVREFGIDVSVEGGVDDVLDEQHQLKLRK